jgi:hypothetical protein
MDAPIQDRFLANHGRAVDLVRLHDALVGEIHQRGFGQIATDDIVLDLLRASVVLLHASLEDLMRTAGSLRLPLATSEVLKNIPCGRGDARRTTMTLGDLADFRGQSVEDVISKNVETYLDRRSYNDPTELAVALAEMGLSSKLVTPYAPLLMAMMKRRHHIAHQLDLNVEAEPSGHQTHPIDAAGVRKWAEAVRQFGLALIEALNSAPGSEERKP